MAKIQRVILDRLIVSVLLLLGSFSYAQIDDFNGIDFIRADSFAAIYQKHSINNLPELSYKLTSSLDTDVEKFRAIYKWVCDNIENDYNYYSKNKRKREKLNDSPNELAQWNEEFRPMVFEKLIKEYKTVCTGYAYLIKELAYHANIESEMINGYGRTAHANIDGEGIPNHTWNAVKLNNKWYLCDATWSSGSIIAGEAKFLKQFSDAYFLVEPSLFIQNHYPLDTNWLLMESEPELSGFLTAPLVYKDALSNSIVPVYPLKFHSKAKKGEELTFQFKSPNKIEELKLEVHFGSNIKMISPEVYKNNDGLYCVNYTFSSKGSYDVHFKKDNKYLFTYVIESIK